MTRIIDDVKLDYDDVLLVPVHNPDNDNTSRKDADLTSEDFPVRGIPIFAANMDGVGTFDMARELAKHRMFTCLTKHYTVEDLVRFFTDSANADIIPFTVYSMGANLKDYQKFALVNEHIEESDSNLDAQTVPQMVCIDVANGYTKFFEDFIATFHEQWPTRTIIAGNVATPERAHALIRAGANFVKVGIGGGSVCSTRMIAGVGYPQFSAVLECAEAAYEARGGVIADGGCKNPGDVAKAFGAGAAGVMLGGMLAGHNEGGVRSVGQNEYGDTVVPFYGMASRQAQIRHNGGVQDYRSSEGRERLVTYKGRVEDTALHILGGLRSALLYTGNGSLMELQRHARFVKVNRQYNKVFE